MPFNAMMKTARSLCWGSPTVQSASHTVNHQACGSGGLTIDISWSLSNTPGTHKIEIWRKTSSGGAFAYWVTKNITDTQHTENLSFYGNDGAGAQTDIYRQYDIRVVPAGAAAGAGPFCDTKSTTATNTTTWEC